MMLKKIVACIVGAVFGYWLIDDFDPDTLRGKRVLVTGASTGIGEQIAYHYAMFGADVIVTARRKAVLQNVANRCQELGVPGGIYGYVSADMANMSSTSHVIEESVSRLGGLDILVLNHILPSPMAPWSWSEQNLTTLQNLIDVNFRSYVHLTASAMPHLKKSGGSIIVMSSVIAKVGLPFNVAYSSTKFALYGFFSSLQNELVSQSPVAITICTIGLVGTENCLNELRSFGSDQKIFTFVTPAEPKETALAVIKAGALRQREVIYPYLSVKPMCLMRDVLPKLTNTIARFFIIPSHFM